MGGELKMVPLVKDCTVPPPTFSGCPVGGPSLASPQALRAVVGPAKGH